MLIEVLEQGIDVTVTIPVINTNDIGEGYSRVHSGTDWEILRNAVNKKFPEYENSFNQLCREAGLFFSYNVHYEEKRD